MGEEQQVSEEDGGSTESELKAAEQTKLEVGERLTSRSLPCVLALVMEDWADWLLVIPQIKARVRCRHEWAGVRGLASSFWEHAVLSEPDLCVLVSGSLAFVNQLILKVPEGIVIVVAVPGRKRRHQMVNGGRLWWRMLRHQDVGGVTTIRCTLGFPQDWPEFQLRPHVQRQVKHVVIHSERPR